MKMDMIYKIGRIIRMTPEKKKIIPNPDNHVYPVYFFPVK